MPRRTGEETRQLLLRTGVEMLLARGVSAGVGHIRLQEVVRRAQLTTGAAYRLWADQDDFHRDLAVEVTRMRDEAPAAEIRQVLDDPAMAGVGWEEVVRLATEGHIRSVHDRGSREDRLFAAALALRSTARTWDDLAEASLARHEQSMREFEEIYGLLMTAHGYRMRPPLVLRDFTTAMAALAEGFAVQAVEGAPHPTFSGAGARAGVEGEPDAIDLAGGDWTLFGLAVRTLVQGFMTADGPDDEDAARPEAPPDQEKP